MMIYVVLCCMLCSFVMAESPIQGVRPTNVLGSSEQHASFSFVRPGLTQTSFAFNGPSSHQSFSSSIGNPYLAQRVLPNVAQALAYRNPGLGFFANGHAAHGYATAPVPAPLSYQTPLDQATALTYFQQHQLQQQQLQQPYLQNYIGGAAYPTQLAQYLALRQAQLQAQAHAQLPEHVQSQQVQGEDEAQRQEAGRQEAESQQQVQNLLGIVYSPATSVSQVNVTGNGYKFNF